MRFFKRLIDSGVIVGVCEMSLDDARLNLSPGEELAPWDPEVLPHRHRWSAEDGRYVDFTPPARRAADYAFMRATGYDVPAQVGALMKVVEAVVADPRIATLLPPDVRAEFDACARANAAVKATHPKA